MRLNAVYCIAGAMLVSGCDKLSSSSQSAPIRTVTVEGNLRGNQSGGEEVRVWRDPETGCQYLLWERRRRGGITPRLTMEGRPMCGA
ncbi:DUF6440 family protein [Sphingomonas sp. ZB1N12]|jgi:hypothetical protein|uniref:DUF6440 family protein n=1 Tax=Sphingomonas arabinosi TaxID=3096160 RepID=UPI003FA71468